MILLVRDPRAVYKSRSEEKVARWCKNVAPCYNMAVSCNITYHDLQVMLEDQAPCNNVAIIWNITYQDIQVMLPDGAKMWHHATTWLSAATSHIKTFRYSCQVVQKCCTMLQYGCQLHYHITRFSSIVARWVKNVALCYNMAVSCNITYQDLQV